jgi:hypothetical protein
VEMFDVIRVMPLQEGGGVEDVVGGLVGHGGLPVRVQAAMRVQVTRITA